MPPHKFQIGQVVEMVTAPGDPLGIGHAYTITRLLTGDAQERSYHTRSKRDGHERACGESWIRAASDTGSPATSDT